MGRYTMGATVRDVIIFFTMSLSQKGQVRKNNTNKKCAAALWCAHFFVPPTQPVSAVTVATVTAT